MAFSPDDHSLVTGSDDHTAILWQVAPRLAPTRLSTLNGHDATVAAVVFGPDHRTVATGGTDGTAILWDVTDRSRPLRDTTLTGRAGAIEPVAFSLDGARSPTTSRVAWSCCGTSATVRVPLASQ
jgi:WD40 repeat protein